MDQQREAEEGQTPVKDPPGQRSCCAPREALYPYLAISHSFSVMGSKEITSLLHPQVLLAVRLRLDKKEREKEGLVLVAGKKLVSDLSSFYPIHTLFFTKALPKPLRTEKVFQVPPQVLKKISGFEEKDGCAAFVPLPKPEPLAEKRHLLILDGLTDPGNLGTLWRSALALGWEGVWLTPGTVDPFNDKALRAAKGATFRLPFAAATPEELSHWARQKKATLFTADLEGKPLCDCVPVHPPIALILGSEGQGPGSWAKTLSSKVTIPMKNGVDSLNVASAGAILLYEMRPGR